MKMTLGQVLTIGHGKFMCDDVRHLYEALNFMTGDNLFTHQLPRAGRECAGPIREQLPWLGDPLVIELISMANKDNAKEILADLGREYGAEFEVEPLPKGRHEHIDPITELAEMTDAPIVAVVSGGSEANDDA